MSDEQTLPRFRSIRRFWNPVENRYWSYERPSSIDAICNRCGKRYVFHPTAFPTHSRNPESGGYEVLKGEICGDIKGRGACLNCGKVFSSIDWPAAASLSVQVSGGIFWAWNVEQLTAIRARISGDKVTLRTLAAGDWQLARIVGRIPKFATLKKNRERILREIDKWLCEDRRRGVPK